MNRSRPYLPALSSSRFPPALLVVTYHVILAYFVLGQMQFDPVLLEDPNVREGLAEFQSWCMRGAAVFESSFLLRNYLRGAAVTLSFFFTLSGFILAYTYLQATSTPPLDKREFWINRVARVYPVYGLALVITFPLFLVMQASRQPSVTAGELFYNGLSTIFLLQSWYPGSVHAWNPPGWSLSCEAFFYVLFPWLVLWIDRCTERRLLSIIVGCWALSLTPPALYSALDPDGIGRVIWTSEAFWLFVVKFNPILRLPEFISGIALGKLFLQRAARTSDGESTGGGAWMSCSAAAVILVICGIADSLPFLMLHNGLLTPLFAILIYGLALEGGPLARGLSRPSMALLGDSTYALYILHYPIITYLMFGVAIARGRIMSPMAFLGLCVALGVAISVPVYRYYEVPMRRFIRRRWQTPSGSV